jgi:hypothetical protein
MKLIILIFFKKEFSFKTIVFCTNKNHWTIKYLNKIFLSLVGFYMIVKKGVTNRTLIRVPTLLVFH